MLLGSAAHLKSIFVEVIVSMDFAPIDKPFVLNCMAMESKVKEWSSGRCELEWWIPDVCESKFLPYSLSQLFLDEQYVDDDEGSDVWITRAT